MKQPVVAFLLSLLFLVSCTVEEVLPTTTLVVQIPTHPSMPADSLTDTPVPTVPTTVTPTLITPTATQEPTQRPTITPTILDPSLPLPTGRIYFLWNPNPIPEERGIGELPETNLYEAIPGVLPNEWRIESIVEMVGQPFMMPSPDSLNLAILRYDDTNENGIVEPQGGLDIANVYAYNTMNGSLTQLTENQWSPGTLSWLSDAQALTYPQLNDLHVVELNNPFHARKLVSYSGNIYYHSWSPDSYYLASLHAPSAQPASVTIFDIFNPENNVLSIISEITNTPNKLLWSQDNQWIAFSHYIDRGLQIVNVPAGEMEELVPFDKRVFSEWSPNEPWLAFSYDSKLFLWDASTENSTEIFNAEVLNDPAWSPDGSAIAIGYVDEEQSGILIISLDNDSQERLNLDMIVNQVFWSPDGQWLLFSSGLDDRVGLYMVNREGGIPFLFLETTGREFPYAIFWLPIQ